MRTAAARLTLREFLDAEEPYEPGRLCFPFPDPGRKGRPISRSHINKFDVPESSFSDKAWVAVAGRDMLGPGVERSIDLLGRQAVGDRDDKEGKLPARLEDPPTGSQHGELVRQSTQHIRTGRGVKPAVSQGQGLAGRRQYASVDALVVDTAHCDPQAFER